MSGKFGGREKGAQRGCLGEGGEGWDKLFHPAGTTWLVTAARVLLSTSWTADFSYCCAGIWELKRNCIPCQISIYRVTRTSKDFPSVSTASTSHFVVHLRAFGPLLKTPNSSTPWLHGNPLAHSHLLQVSNSVFAKKRGIENFHLDRYNPEGTPPDTVRFLNIGDVKRKRLSVEAALATGGLMAHCGWGWICTHLLPPCSTHGVPQGHAAGTKPAGLPKRITPSPLRNHQWFGGLISTFFLSAIWRGNGNTWGFSSWCSLKYRDLLSPQTALVSPSHSPLKQFLILNYS